MVPTLTPRGRIVDLTALVRDEYREMPGMCLTLAQGARLWNAERAHCRDAFGQLIAEGLIAQVGEVYVRADNPRYMGEDPATRDALRAREKAACT
jgi:hypothetical protein